MAQLQVPLALLLWTRPQLNNSPSQEDQAQPLLIPEGWVSVPCQTTELFRQLHPSPGALRHTPVYRTALSPQPLVVHSAPKCSPCMTLRGVQHRPPAGQEAPDVLCMAVLITPWQDPSLANVVNSG